TLYQLDPSTGRVAWSQRLSSPLGRLPHFPLRRLAGANPSFAGGLLICPTTAGVVVACDLAARTLQWEYRYPINVAAGLSDPRTAWVDEPQRTGNDEESRWLDASPLIAEGSV